MALKAQPTSVNATASTPAKSDKACRHFDYLAQNQHLRQRQRRQRHHQRQVVPTATPSLVSIASATGITPVAFEYRGCPSTPPPALCTRHHRPDFADPLLRHEAMKQRTDTYAEQHPLPDAANDLLTSATA